MHFYVDTYLKDPLMPGKRWWIPNPGFANGYVKYIVDQLITTLYSLRENNIGAAKIRNSPVLINGMVNLLVKLL